MQLPILRIPDTSHINELSNIPIDAFKIEAYGGILKEDLYSQQIVPGHKENLL